MFLPLRQLLDPPFFFGRLRPIWHLVEIDNFYRTAAFHIFRAFAGKIVLFLQRVVNRRVRHHKFVVRNVKIRIIVVEMKDVRRIMPLFTILTTKNEVFALRLKQLLDQGVRNIARAVVPEDADEGLPPNGKTRVVSLCQS